MVPYDSNPQVARRLISTKGGAFLLHQEHLTKPIRDYYECPDYPNCPSKLLPFVALLSEDFTFQGRMAIPFAALTVDVAISTDNQQFLVVAAGNVTLPGNSTNQYSPLLIGKTSELNADGSSKLLALAIPSGMTLKPVAAAPLGLNDFVVLTRGKAPSLYRVSGGTHAITLMAKLDDNLPVNPGFEMFHAGTRAGHACASCHAEGGDDSHTWTRLLPGDVPEARRTKSLVGGLLNKGPFRWDGSHPDVDVLSMEDMQSMGEYSPDRMAIHQMATWLDSLPAAWSPATWKADQDQLSDGKEVFKNNGCGMSNCHSGQMLTSGQKVAITGLLAIKVPSLIGVGSHAPYFHGGCAADLPHALDGTCKTNDAGGGGVHNISNLPAADQRKLVAYLRSL